MFDTGVLSVSKLVLSTQDSPGSFQDQDSLGLSPQHQDTQLRTRLGVCTCIAMQQTKHTGTSGSSNAASQIG